MRLGKLIDKIAELRYLQECYLNETVPPPFKSKQAMLRHMSRISNIEVGYIPPEIPKGRRSI